MCQIRQLADQKSAMLVDILYKYVLDAGSIPATSTTSLAAYATSYAVHAPKYIQINYHNH